MKKKFTMSVIGALLVCMTFVESISAQTNLKSNQMRVVIQTTQIKGIDMVPLREVGEKLGFSIQWNATDHTIYLDDGLMNTTLTVGLDSYYAASSNAIGMSGPQSFGVEPILIGDKVYVPAEMFSALLGNNEDAVILSDGIITFTKN